MATQSKQRQRTYTLQHRGKHAPADLLSALAPRFKAEATKDNVTLTGDVRLVESVSVGGAFTKATLAATVTEQEQDGAKPSGGSSAKETD